MCVCVIPGSLSSRFSGLAESRLAQSQEVAVVLSGMVQMTLSRLCACVCACVYVCVHVAQLSFIMQPVCGCPKSELQCFLYSDPRD